MITLKKFYGTWCAPCRALKPIIEQLHQENPGVDMLTIDVDDNADLAAKYNVRSVPTVVIEKNGVEIARIVGARGKAEYQKILTENKG